MKTAIPLSILGFILGLAPCNAAQRPDIVIEDFEGDMAGWKAEGEAFADLNKAKDRIKGFMGGGLANSDGGVRDLYSGSLSSEEFIIERPYIHFLMGGRSVGKHSGLELLVDGKAEYLAQVESRNTLSLMTFDVSSFQGKRAQLIIRDSGGWQFVLVDHIVASDSLRENVYPLYPVSQTVPLDKRMEMAENNFLELPINFDAPRIRYVLEVDGAAKLDIELRLAANRPVDFCAMYPLKHLKPGVELRMYSEGAAIYKDHLEAMEDEIKLVPAVTGRDRVYSEPARPQLRFTPDQGRSWDPNGLYYYNGLWHLFFQYNPVGVDGGNQHWGHATSTNLFDWVQQDFGIPKGLRWDAFSGSGVVDRNNDSGLQEGDVPPILLFYSQNRRSATALAYSTDGGKTYLQYKNNPLFLTNDPAGHDPKVVWYPPQKKWVMIIHDRRNKGPWTFDFYDSKNLVDWNWLSSSPDWFETPDLFCLPLDGNPENMKWIVQDVSRSYRIGKFDGREFVPETKQKIQTFKGMYLAPQTFNNAPGGRCIMMGATPTCDYFEHDPSMPVSGGLNIPIEATLRSFRGAPRLYLNPVREIDGLVTAQHSFRNIQSDSLNAGLSEIKPGLYDIEFEWDAKSSRDFNLAVWGQDIFSFRAKNSTYEIADLGYKAIEPVNGMNRVRLICDRGMVSYYTNDGYEGGNALFPHPRFHPDFIPPEKPNMEITAGSPLEFAHFRLRELRSASRR
ncbi:Levanase [Pontiella desulfatans]|uniref:Levanase n=1 Tax=Pontiella desulfatans TaxID=2750659 RepID=A0A6C2U9V1_PONDE|nr:glycoside hydrolase family 32 protein [Pontiella desulfatans]VGO16882.1 Levanase [Pontiella desulfatans]